VRSFVFHTARFTPEGVAWLAQARAAGDLHGGGVTFLAALFGGPQDDGAPSWRRERGALWDVGPHALDAVLSALGPVERLVALGGRGDTAHLVLRHAGGASSALTLSLSAPAAVRTNTAWVYGPDGLVTRPPLTTPPSAAFSAAVDALLDERPHESDVRHAAAIVALLARAERLLSAPG